MLNAEQLLYNLNKMTFPTLIQLFATVSQRLLCLTREGHLLLIREIFGEQFLREGRVVIIGCTCNNFSNEIKRFVSVMVVVVVVIVDVVYDTLPLL
jgi:hypothetical protein